MRPAAFPSALRIWPAAAIAAVLAVTLIAPPAAAATNVSVEALSVSGQAEPIGVGGTEPEFGWQLAGDRRGIQQAAYQVRLAESADALSSSTVWDTGRVESRESIAVAYDGPELASQQDYWWQVRVWDDEGVESSWSEPAHFRTAILHQDEWQGDWIGGPDAADRLSQWTDYTVSTDFTLVPGTAFGLFLRAETLGNSYMWQLNDEAPGNPRLRPHVRTNGGWSTLPEVSLTSRGLAADVLKQRASLEISLIGDQIVTTINGTEVSRVTNTRYSRGFVGVRTSQSTTANESVVLHNLHVETPGGEVLLDTTFDGENRLSRGTLVEGGVQLTGNHEAIVTFDDRVPLLRTEFDVDGEKEIRRATVSATARGIYQLRLNGEKVGDLQLAPGWTDYGTRIHFQTYDVTDQLQAGANALGGIVAPGWYSGRLAHIGDQNYGTRDSLIAQLRIEYADGTVETVATDGDWTTAPGPWTAADLIDGESYDARLEIDGWDVPEFDDSDWESVWVAPSATDKLQPQPDEPVRETGVQQAIERTEPEPGAHVYDLGQNMVGVVRVTLRGEPGQTVKLRYAEELNRDDGTMYTANLRSAKATDYYTFGDEGEVVYEPSLTFHGFRYLEITGTDQPPALDEVTGRVWNSDLRMTGELTTSSAMLNQLQSNIVWGQRGNFLSIPTDTPARDERMGWSGDINVFAPTASYNMDTVNFLAKWLVDLQDAQLANGDYMGVAPYHPNLSCCGGGTGWSDAGITVPWAIWQSWGSTAPIRDGWESMTRFMDFLERTYPSGIRPSSYADWLNLDDPTPGNVLGTAYFAYVAGLMSEMADAIGEPADAEHYAELSERVAAAFADRFVADDGTVTGDSQAAYAIAIGMGLVPDELIPAAADRFEATIARRDFHLSTGFLGTPWLVPSLAESGKLDLAYRLLMNETFPSWGYEVAMGATTMWERWSSILPDGRFSSPEYPQEGMNSFNHYAYGAIGDFMYRSIGGIAPAEPGYRDIRIEPVPGGGLTSATGSFDSRYGTISSSWRIVEGGFELDATVPANTTATVVLPAGTQWAVTEGGVRLDDVDGVTDVTVTDSGVEVRIGSGEYAFRVDDAADLLGALLDAIDAAGDPAAELRPIAIAALEAFVDRAPLREVLGHLAELLERLDAAEPGDAAALEPVLRALGASTAALTGVESALRPTGEVALPGSSAGVELTLRNGASTEVDGIEATVTSRDDWTVDPERQRADGALAVGATAVLTASVEVDGSAEPGDMGAVDAYTRFDLGGNRLVVAAATTLAVDSPISLGDPVVAPASAGPESVVAVTVPVTNSGAVPVTAEVVVDVPSAWGAKPRSGSLIVPAGGTIEALVELAVPVTVTAVEYSLPVTAVRGDAVFDRVDTTLPVTLDRVQYDWIDFGNSASEQAHGIAHSGSSGTSTEAGLTRRYSHGGVANSWFEATVAVPTSGEFRLRAIETFGRAGTKDYFITADGVEIAQRLHTESAGGAYTYEIDVTGLAEQAADGEVVIRFQRTAGSSHNDASIADLWIYDPAVSDHVDLGFGYSETQHRLTAAPSSATSTEAGLTRRYSGVNTPGSWFEFDLAVPAGEPVVIRAIETYDGPQQKDYTVFADGQPIDVRSMPRTESGSGTRVYQALVADTALTEDGVLRIRMQKANSGPERHDPSIADVWAVALAPDTVAPVVSASLDDRGVGSAGWARGDVDVTITAVDGRDPAPSVEYAVGDAPYEAYTGPFAVTAEGETVVRYRATDASGNSRDGETVVRIDRTAPNTELSLSGAPTPSGWHAGGTTATVVAEDAASGVASAELRIGSGAWQPALEPVALPDGEYTVEYRSRDVAGNVSEVAQLAVRVDGTAPTLEAEIDGVAGLAGWWISAEAEVQAEDTGSGVASIEVRVGGDWVAYDGPVGLPEGVWVVEARATDHAGNVEEIALDEVAVDGIAPTVTAEVGNDRMLRAAGADEGSGVAALEYAVGDADWAAYTGAVKIATDAVSVSVRAVDAAGNTSAVTVLDLPGGRITPSLIGAGGEVHVSATGFAPGEQVRIELRSDPVLLATVTADAEGRVDATVTIPKTTAAGAHQLVLTGVQSGTVLAFDLEVTAFVYPGTTIPVTGVTLAPALALVALLLGLGTMLVIRRRRSADVAE
ncbi:family 78 glycoside hydrolase catalytic domain [Agromyces silvae]|uniref:family 78 glycoside hydrolase catalytic domain n=1 Tax=Agromyces silvae TaxID=3388266 RepID=UPI00280BF437|nr:family 78 glycoside hydrolase catalytic domain [Agromyces protaetiae]